MSRLARGVQHRCAQRDDGRAVETMATTLITKKRATTLITKKSSETVAPYGYVWLTCTTTETLSADGEIIACSEGYEHGVKFVEAERRSVGHALDLAAIADKRRRMGYTIVALG